MDKFAMVSCLKRVLSSPWRDDHEAWWRDVSGYEPLWYPFAHGGYKPGVELDDPRIREYFVHRLKWDNENPFPVTLVYCDFSEVILAVTSSLVVTDGTEAFNPVDLTVSGKDVDILLNFCRKWVSR